MSNQTRTTGISPVVENWKDNEYSSQSKNPCQGQEEINKVIDGIGDMLFVLDADQRIVIVNRKTCEVFKKKPEELLGKHCYEIIHRANKPWPNCPATKTFYTKQTCEMEILDPNLNIPLVVTTSPIFDRKGELTRCVHVAKNISERVKAEERIAMVNEKLRVVGSLTRHDIRNKLSTVTLYSYVLKKKLADQPDIVQKIEKMEQSVKEVERILEFAKVYEQLGVEELVDIDVTLAIEEAVNLFSALPFTVVNSCRGLTVLADSFLRQLIYNFIDNTRKYGQKTTEVRIYYRETAQDSLELTYEDNGIGIPLENKGQLFKRGFSTGGSSGFGLFLSKNMLDVYGWKIEEIGEPGKGVKFVVSIPKTNQKGQNNYKIQV